MRTDHTDRKEHDVNKDQHKTPTSAIATGGGGPDTPWAAFTGGLMAGVRPFGPAMRLLLAISFWVLAILLLGAVAIYAARGMGPPLRHLLALLGEGLVVLGALGMLIGAVRVWGRMIRVSLKSIGRTTGSMGGGPNDHR